jgi:hypothetical protein
MDLVFDTATSDTDSLYQVFHRVVNLTGQMLDGFSVQLGTGVGDAFQSSSNGDGLAFSSTVALGPNNESAFSQFPFGLFGSTAQPNPNPNFTLGGFFDTTERSGFDLTRPDEDTINSAGFYGSYGSLFGGWLDQSMAPMDCCGTSTMAPPTRWSWLGITVWAGRFAVGSTTAWMVSSAP